MFFSQTVTGSLCHWSHATLSARLCALTLTSSKQHSVHCRLMHRSFSVLQHIDDNSVERLVVVINPFFWKSCNQKAHVFMLMACTGVAITWFWFSYLERFVFDELPVRHPAHFITIVIVGFVKVFKSACKDPSLFLLSSSNCVLFSLKQNAVLI